MSDSVVPNTTSSAGVPVPSDEHSLTVGRDGPMRFDPSRAAAPYAPNSKGGPAAAADRYDDPSAGWSPTSSATCSPG